MNPTPANPPPHTGTTATDAGARRRAAALAGHTGDRATAAAMLADSDAGVRATALGALARCDAIDADICTRVVGDPDPGVRRRLAEELGRHRPTEPDRTDAATQIALQLLDDPDPMVAEAAAWALGELAGPDPDDPADLLDDRTGDFDNDNAGDNDNADDNANDAGNHRPSAAAVTSALARTATDHPDPLVRESAVAALGAVGDSTGLAAVLAATTDKPAVRRRAVIALASFLDEPGVDEALRRATGDRDWQVRQAADMLLDASD